MVATGQLINGSNPDSGTDVGIGSDSTLNRDPSLISPCVQNMTVELAIN